MSYERSSNAADLIMPSLTAGVLAMVMMEIGIAVGEHKEHADTRVHDVQIANEQLRAQLTTGHTVNNLVLNDKGKTFTFRTTDTLNHPEICTGSYRLEKGNATLLGSLSCTQTVPARG